MHELDRDDSMFVYVILFASRAYYKNRKLCSLTSVCCSSMTLLRRSKTQELPRVQSPNHVNK